MPKREVTEFDLRAPEFQRADVKPEDYEFRDDGKVVRKDRWETGLRNVASAIGWARREYEIPEVVEEVRRLKNKVAPTETMQQALDALQGAHEGLKWYRDRHPEDVNGSDDEADELIAEAIAALEKALTDGVLASEPAKPAMLDRLFDLAKSLSDERAPLAIRARHVQRELAVICKELLATHGVDLVDLPQQHESPEKWVSKADMERAHGVMECECASGYCAREMGVPLRDSRCRTRGVIASDGSQP